MLTAVQTEDPIADPKPVIAKEDNSLDFTEMDSWALTAQGNQEAANLNLPDNFEDFNAKKFIEAAYGLATQI